ncbi:MAG: lipid biosynthesis B12-binding/radical SAM protein [Desulforhopalus sp.]|nr:lipid biosynthesis B12-binding/radical SAM protein [Desulforhopalus sp.]
MNILLISPNTLTVPYPVYPIGLDYVAGAIPAGHQVRIADLNIISRGELAALIASLSPQLIGISIRNIDNTEAGDPLFFIQGYRELVAWLREQSSAIIVCGGSGFTIVPEQIMAMLEVDYGIVGEGERLGQLVDALDQGRDPTAISGVLSAGEVPVLPPPWPGQQLRRFQSDASHNQFYLRNGGMLNLQTKRGCSFRCIYCSYPQIEGKTHRLADPQEIAATALQLQQAGAKYLFFTDSAFNSDIAHSAAVAEALHQAGLTLPWGAFFAPVRLPEDYFPLMSRAGCRHVEFGTESLSGAMLKTYRKPFGQEDVLAAHRQARSAGLHVAHYFLFGGPGESAATVNQSLDGIEQLDKAVFFFFVGIRIYPGTALYELAIAEKKLDRRADILHPVFYQPDDIDREAIELLVQERAKGRGNWVIGSGGAKTAAIIRALHRRGLTGPLWEHLIR